MAISNKINDYINNSLIRGKLCKWNKNMINIFITPINTSYPKKDFMYLQITNAIASWNKTLRENYINIQFQTTQSAANADIVIHWVKVGRVYEGMCKYLSVTNNIINKISIDIGLENELSPKNVTDLSIYCAIMHELGHALGLGHGIEIDDIMYVPHQKNIQTPSENDIYVLKEIYK